MAGPGSSHKAAGTPKLLLRGLRPLLLLVLLSWSGSAVGQTPSTQEAIAALPWTLGSGFRTVPGVDATYTQSADQMWLSGEDAVQFLTLAHAFIEPSPSVGLAINMHNGTVIIIENDASGYVEQTKMEHLHPAMVLGLVRQLHDRANTDRRRNGQPTVDQIEYEIEPWYNPRLNAAYWAVRLRDNQGVETINAVALKLSRSGYAVISWFGPHEHFAGHRTMEATLAAFRFNAGARYADFREGDPVAEADLEGLMAHLLGVPPSVITAFSLLKHAWVVLLLPLFFAGFRRYWRQG